MAVKEPRTVDQLSEDYLTPIARDALGDPSAEVTGFQVLPEPFQFPRFGEKRFYDIPFEYRGSNGKGHSNLILRVLPPMDAVMMLTGDTQHRELRAFKTGLFSRVPDTFRVPYRHVIYEPSHHQYWAFVDDVRPQMAALGMHAALPDETMRTILSHLAVFHASFWEDRQTLSHPWLMRLEQPVDYFYRCIVDILDGLEDPADSTAFMVERWPWFPDGVRNLMASLSDGTRRSIEALYREPERLLKKVRPLPRTLCHYDFDNRNLGIEQGPDGPRTVVIDWEIVGEGVSSADVCRFLSYQQPPNAGELIGHYVSELERHLGRPLDRREWLYGFELVSVAIWQIVGVLFGVMVSAPSAPVPDEQRDAMRRRVFSDIAWVEALVKKHGLG
jgi:hypothetical protein